MEVTILEDGLHARSVYGITYVIMGIEVIRDRTKQRIIYKPGSKFFDLCARPGTKSQATILENNKVMLR